MPAVGDVLGDRYRIDGLLGAGGMASVYRATDLRLERSVAIKVLLPNLATDPALAERFDREARMLAAVAHPNVAAVFDVEPGDPVAGREPFYVMELCDGGSLADRIRAADGSGLDPVELVPVVQAVAEGLDELHRSGVIHRDVKPGNILFAGGRPKLADFGLAKTDGSADATTLTAPGTTLGTLPYLAPELLAGAAPTVASDAFALGATTYHGLTGRYPRPSESIGELVDARLTPVPPVSSANPRLGTAFDEPVGHALAIDPAARTAPAEFARELAASLDRWRAEGSSPAPDPDAVTAVAIPVRGSASGQPAVAATRAVGLPGSAVMRGSRTAGPRTAQRRRAGFRSDWRTAGGVGLLALTAIVLALAGLQALGAPAAAPGASPSPSPSPAVSPSLPATASPDPAAPALQALDAVYAAIADARGGKDGLGGGEARDLEQAAADVGQALRAADFTAARNAADTLEERAIEVTDKLERDRREALLAAIHDLQDAIPTA